MFRDQRVPDEGQVQILLFPKGRFDSASVAEGLERRELGSIPGDLGCR